MWSTHPSNDVREANAKRIYIPAPLDDRSGWLLFDRDDALRAQVTAQLYARAPGAPDEAEPPEPRPIEDTLTALDAELDKRYLDPRYHGVYLGRSIVRVAGAAAELYGDEPAPAAIVEALETLYPAQLAEDLEQLRELSEERALLRALQRGILEAPGGVVRHRGQEHHRREIPRLLAEVDREIAEVREVLAAHDRQVRTAHVAAARLVSPAWEAALRGLLAIHHYADHREADLEDAAGALHNVVAIALADGRVSAGERERVLAAAQVVYGVIRDIHQEADAVELGALAGKLEVDSFKASLEPLRLNPPSPNNLGDWLGAAGSWVADVNGSLSALSRAALDELLRGEEEVARRVRAAGAASALVDTAETAAPVPARPPSSYPVLVAGAQRPRQLALGWWDKFQVADGVVATAARFLVAAAIIGCVVWAGQLVRSGTVTVVNGLARAVVVAIGSSSVTVAAHHHAELDVGSGDHTIRATTADGQLIEQLDASVDRDLGHYVYNVAGAAVILEARAGSDGTPEVAATRWRETSATRIFDATQRVRMASKGETVLVDTGAAHPWQAYRMGITDPSAIALAHVRWDPPGTDHLVAWIDQLRRRPELPALIQARLASDPDDVAALRAEQDLGPNAEVCARHRARAAALATQPAWQYLAARCITDRVARDQGFATLAERFPTSGWVLYAAGLSALDRDDYDRAASWLTAALPLLPETRDAVADRLVRARRLHQHSMVPIGGLAGDSPRLDALADVESVTEHRAPPLGRAFQRLYRGDIAAAVAEDATHDPSLLILAAASEGAPDAVIARALDMPPGKIPPLFAVYGQALARRAGRDPGPYQERFAAELADDAPHVAAFFAAVGHDPRAAEAALAGMQFEVRTSVLAAGVVVLGASSPDAWRDIARFGLFPTERPYLR